ncbi:unnamed protein product [Eruca vesicaria subsp. sativa]|uniref:Uncharacterized protein n=1 Tax=Eruca vesicaria subsp. sativa TaxID=29727 RepID=A0ABC8K2L0_ERUVS|nr:unnamed protein product [Eruca vesicaria subsp. sativa]
MEVENTSSKANNKHLPPCSPMTPRTKRQVIILTMKVFKKHQQSLWEHLKRVK